MDNETIEKFKHILIEQRDSLLSAQQLAQDSTGIVELDQSSVGRVSRVDALQSQSMALEGSRLRQQQLRKISTALALIDSGDYGYCESCDQAIDVRRLEIDPAATLCVPCASRRE